MLIFISFTNWIYKFGIQFLIKFNYLSCISYKCLRYLNRILIKWTFSWEFLKNVSLLMLVMILNYFLCGIEIFGIQIWGFVNWKIEIIEPLENLFKIWTKISFSWAFLKNFLIMFNDGSNMLSLIIYFIDKFEWLELKYWCISW